jgi:hypothetical protein
MKTIIKVDRVASRSEALILQSLEVDIIGVCIAEDPRFTDNRQISISTLREIRESVHSSKIACQISPECYDSLDEIKSHCDFIQCLYFQLDESWNSLSSKINAGIIYSLASPGHDDDISWSFNLPMDNAQYIHIDLLANMNNAWNFLTNECPKYPDCLQIKDVSETANSYPLLLGIDGEMKNFQECKQLIPNMKGFNFTLADFEPMSNNVHWINYENLCHLLNSIRSSYPSL